MYTTGNKGALIYLKKVSIRISTLLQKCLNENAVHLNFLFIKFWNKCITVSTKVLSSISNFNIDNNKCLLRTKSNKIEKLFYILIIFICISCIFHQ